MNLSLRSLLVLSAAVGLSSCYVWQPPQPEPHGPRGGYQEGASQGGSRYWEEPTAQEEQGPPFPPPVNNGSNMTPPNNRYQEPTDPAAIVAPNPNNSAPVQPPVNPPVANNPQPAPPPVVPPANTPAPTPVKPSGPPFGIKVPNKAGFVYSPFDRTAGIVDVQGMAAGTKVKCPYTGKVFIVP
jgi:hypothetical protein